MTVWGKARYKAEQATISGKCGLLSGKDSLLSCKVYADIKIYRVDSFCLHVSVGL